MKKILIVIMSLIMMTSCLGAFVGCNKGEEKDPTLDADAVTVTVGIRADGTEKAYFNTLKKAFNKTNKKINLQSRTFSDYTASMKTFISTDSVPDIMWCPGDFHSPFSNAGHYEDLTPYFEKDGINIDDYYKTSMDSARLTNDPTSDKYNAIWFMPRDYNRLTIAYNKTMFTAGGIPFPTDDWTWSDFLNICKTLREKMDANVAPQSGLSKYSFPANLLINDNVGGFTALTSFGGKLINEDGTSAINTPETQKAYSDLREYVKKGYFLDPSKSSSVDFARNTLAMTALVRPVVPNYINTNIDFDFVAYPRSETTKVGAGCTGYAISSKSKVKDEAWEFLKFIGSKAGQEAFATTAGCVPSLKSVAEDVNSKWRKFTSSNGSALNHKAFISNSESDLYLNIFNKKDPRIADSLLKFMQDSMYACMHDTFNGKGSIAGVTAYYAKEIDNKKY